MKVTIEHEGKVEVIDLPIHPQAGGQNTNLLLQLVMQLMPLIIQALTNIFAPKPVPAPVIPPAPTPPTP